MRASEHMVGIGQHHGRAQRVVQLAEIAGPAIAPESRGHLGVECERHAAIGFGAQQPRDDAVEVGALAQRRQPQSKRCEQQFVAVLGARLTGGGFGGAVLALVTEAFTDAAAERVASAYAARFGARPDVLAVSTAEGAALENP